MTTAIIGVGNIGGAIARHLLAGGEPVVLAAKDEAQRGGARRRARTARACRLRRGRDRR